MTITDLSIKRPLAIGMIFIGFVIFGAISIIKLPVDLFPNVTFPMMIVLTNYPGAGPEEIETGITDPFEKTLGTVNNIKKITSTTSENTSSIFLQFEWGTDMDAASNDARDRLGLVLPYIPKDANQPLIFKFDITQQPVVMYTITGKIDVLELEEIAHDLSEKIQRVDGVAASYALGEHQREVQIVLDPLKLRGTGITIEQVSGMLQMQNVNYPLGNVESGTKVYMLRTIGQYQDLDEIRKTVVGNRNGIPILLSQIAEVRSRLQRQHQSLEATACNRSGALSRNAPTPIRSRSATAWRRR